MGGGGGLPPMVPLIGTWVCLPMASYGKAEPLWDRQTWIETLPSRNLVFQAAVSGRGARDLPKIRFRQKIWQNNRLALLGVGALCGKLALPLPLNLKILRSHASSAFMVHLHCPGKRLIPIKGCGEPKEICIGPQSRILYKHFPDTSSSKAQLLNFLTFHIFHSLEELPKQFTSAMSKCVKVQKRHHA